MVEVNTVNIIAVINQKGGVGKTTTCVNLAAELGALRKKALVIDADPQGNASSGLGFQLDDFKSLYDVLALGEEPKWAIHSTSADNVSLIASNINLVGFDLEMGGAEGREFLLKNALETVRDDYDVVLIDCPPSLGLLTVNALAAADRLLVPLQCEYYAMQGLSLLAHTVQMVRESGINPNAQIDAILLTMYNANLRLTREIEAQIREVFGSRVLKTVIPRNVDLAAAPGQGLAIRDWAKRSRGGEAYHELALEVKKLWL
ncbi:MAG: ParA family protein [Pyramidobacter sp.]|nr:ParA family protein [Pyramidobacter sp.]